VRVVGVEAVALAVLATLLQEFIWLKQSVPENADPARATQELN
jgi:Flp pilus assembly protein CpaB